MKKRFFLAAALAVSVAANAQSYQHSIGLNVGSMEGISYKGFLNRNVAVGLDLGVSFLKTPATVVETYKYNDSNKNKKYVSKGFTYVAWELDLNPNIVYQNEITSWRNAELGWFAGAGASLGMMKPTSVSRGNFSMSLTDYKLSGKFGLNAIGGVEMSFGRTPIAISLDFRPGYGLMFRPQKNETYTYTQLAHFFDWKLVAAVRYTF